MISLKIKENDKSFEKLTPTLRLFISLSSLACFKKEAVLSKLSLYKNYELITLYYEINDWKTRELLDISHFKIDVIREAIKTILNRRIFKKKSKPNILKNNNNYIILTSFLMPNVENTHVKMISNFADAILKANEKFKVFVVVTMERTNEGLWTGNWRIRNDRILYDYFENEFRGRVNFSIYNDLTIDSLTWTLNKIKEISPENIIFHGGPTEPSLTGHFLNETYSTTYLPSNVNDIPSMNVNKILVRTEYMMNRLQSYFFNKRNKPEMKYFDLPLRPIKNEYLKFRRETYDKISIGIVIGRNLVIDFLSSLSDDNFEKFINLFFEGKMTLKVIGDNDYSLLSTDRMKIITELISDQKITFFGSIKESNLAKELKKTGILISLPGISGGGAALSMGAQLGCGLVVCHDNDGRINTSDKFVYKTFDEMINLLYLITVDDNFFKECIQSSKLTVESRIKKKISISDIT